jgi:hypothetical protein
MRAWGGAGFKGRICEIEPDFDAFASRFWQWKKRDERAGLYGRWLNPLGRWDWWDLGGRFDGAILGARGERAVREDGLVSSGPSRGRDMVGAIAEAFGASERDLQALMEANVEPASALLEAAQAGREHAFPTTLLLPAGSVSDVARWVETPDGWASRAAGIPSEVMALLDLDDSASFQDVCISTYRRFSGWAVAGVAYHF